MEHVRVQVWSNGRLVLESVDDAVRRAQALVRQYAPDADGVTDDFLAERHAESGRG